MLSIDYDRMSNVFVDVNVGAKHHNFSIPLILKVMQKLKLMQEISFAINVVCHSTLQVKLLMHNCARAKMQKHVFVAYKGFCFCFC